MTRALIGFVLETTIGLAASVVILAAVLAGYSCAPVYTAPPAVIPEYVAIDPMTAYCHATRDPMAAIPSGVTVPASIAGCVTDSECEAAWAEECAR